MSLKEWCYEWFENTARKDWNGLTVEGVEADLARIPDDERPAFTAQEICDCMVEIIAEYDALNAED